MLLAWLAKGNELTGTHSYLPYQATTTLPALYLHRKRKKNKKTARREGMQLRAACRCRDSRRTASRPGKSTRNGRPPNTAMASTKDRDRKMKVMFFYMVIICIMYVCVGAVQGRHRIYAYMCEAQSGAGMRLAS